jgi:pyridoxal phosphate phosphatase PHOSPHO2
VRLHRSLEKKVKREGQEAGLVAGVKYWDGAWEVEELFKEL